MNIKSLREIEEGLVTADILNEVRQDYEIVDAEEDGEAGAIEAGAEAVVEALNASEPPQEPSI